jgi:hypothetical protein
MNATAAWLNERVLIPDLLRAAPQARVVLDRYGLRGCGGPLGPVESLGFFAQAHDVPIGPLLEEIRAGLERPAAPPLQVVAPDRLADSIYRPFFKAGVAVALTLGAVCGAYLLLRIALEGKFSAAGLHEVNAHGQAQIFGWVGLFVMGFAYQAFPRFKHASLAHPRVAYATLWIMLAGVVGRSVLEPLAAWQPWLAPAAVTASALEVLAAGLFAWVIAATWRAARKPLAHYDAYIACALFWFVVSAAYETVYLAATLAAADHDQVLRLLKTWQPSLRDIEIHGFALLMILGVSQRALRNFFGLPAANRLLSLVALPLLNLAVVGEAAGLVLMQTLNHAWAALWYCSVILLTVTILLLLLDWRPFSRAAESDRSLKFLRAAYVWLPASLGLLLLLPVYLFLLPRLAPQSEAAHIGFSHAYYGAARHAVTVGFVSLMIVGMASRVVPTLNGVDVRRLPALWGPFLLLNAGCLLRVIAQTMTDFTPFAYPLAGASGLLEVLGLTLWGVHLWRIMYGGAGAADSLSTHAALQRGDPIRPDHLVGEVLHTHPQLLEVFLSFGFHPLSNPLLRKTLAGRVTIARACRLLDVDAPRLVDALNAARERARAFRISLPMLSASDRPPAETIALLAPEKSS